MTRCGESAGGVPYWNEVISRSVPQIPASRMLSLTSVGAAITGSGVSMSRTSRLEGNTASDFMIAPYLSRQRESGPPLTFLLEPSAAVEEPDLPGNQANHES